MNRKRGTLPEIEHGIPMPKKIIDGRTWPNHITSTSPWPDFLRSLKVGDSFLINRPEFANVSQQAKQLDIDLVWEYTRSPFGTRVWIYGIPGKRTPIYIKVKEMTFVSYRVEEKVRTVAMANQSANQPAVHPKKP